MKQVTKIVVYHLDSVEYDGCYYDTPGPVFFYYKAKNLFHSGEWIEKHPVYRNSKKISKEQGFCFGGDYGVMKMPRYPVQTTISRPSRTKFDHRLIYRVCYDKMIDQAKSIASSSVRKLDKSGYLIVSFGDMRITPTKNEFAIEFNLGLVLNKMSNTKILEEYAQDFFVWKS